MENHGRTHPRKNREGSLDRINGMNRIGGFRLRKTRNTRKGKKGKEFTTDLRNQRNQRGTW